MPTLSNQSFVSLTTYVSAIATLTAISSPSEDNISRFFTPYLRLIDSNIELGFKNIVFQLVGSSNLYNISLFLIRL